jgi:uncharacterized protein (DUF2062 family)
MRCPTWLPGVIGSVLAGVIGSVLDGCQARVASMQYLGQRQTRDRKEDETHSPI